MTRIKLVSQTEFANMIGKKKSWVNNLCKRIDCPFDVESISGIPFIQMTEATKSFVKKQKADIKEVKELHK